MVGGWVCWSLEGEWKGNGETGGESLIGTVRRARRRRRGRRASARAAARGPAAALVGQPRTWSVPIISESPAATGRRGTRPSLSGAARSPVLVHRRPFSSQRPVSDAAPAVSSRKHPRWTLIYFDTSWITLAR